MDYILSLNGLPKAKAVFVLDLCWSMAAYCGEEGKALESEFFKNGSLKRGSLTIESVKK